MVVQRPEPLCSGLSFLRGTLDVGPVTGGDRELKVLKEMNELQQFENDIWSPRSV